MSQTQDIINETFIKLAKQLRQEINDLKSTVQDLKNNIKSLEESNEQLLAENVEIREQLELQHEILESYSDLNKANANKRYILLKQEVDERSEEEKLEQDIQANTILIQESIQLGDYGSLLALTEHWHSSFKKAVWARLSDAERTQINNLKIAYESYQNEVRQAYESIFGDVTFQNVGSTGKVDFSKPIVIVEDEWGSVETSQAVEAVTKQSTGIDFRSKLKHPPSTATVDDEWGCVEVVSATEAIDGVAA